MISLPALSIVTISRNQARFLKACLDSVIAQKTEGVTYVVVDPGSVDGSREILSDYEREIDTLILDPDSGPADGLNRGFAESSGEVLGYINSDDRFADGALEWVRSFFANNPEIDVLCGAIRLIDEHGRVSLRGRTSDLFNVRRYAAGACCVAQQATFFRRSIFTKAGGFNAANRVAWDGELLVDMALAGGRFAMTRKVLGDFRIYGQSITGSADYMRKLRAYHEVLEKKLARYGIVPDPPLVRTLLRLRCRLNRLRHGGYFFVR